MITININVTLKFNKSIIILFLWNFKFNFDTNIRIITTQLNLHYKNVYFDLYEWDDEKKNKNNISFYYFKMNEIEFKEITYYFNVFI